MIEIIYELIQWVVMAVGLWQFIHYRRAINTCWKQIDLYRAEKAKVVNDHAERLDLHDDMIIKLRESAGSHD